MKAVTFPHITAALEECGQRFAVVQLEEGAGDRNLREGAAPVMGKVRGMSAPRERMYVRHT
jgi:hypothetical protein